MLKPISVVGSGTTSSQLGGSSGGGGKSVGRGEIVDRHFGRVGAAAGHALEPRQDAVDLVGVARQRLGECVDIVDGAVQRLGVLGETLSTR